MLIGDFRDIQLGSTCLLMVAPQGAAVLQVISEDPDGSQTGFTHLTCPSIFLIFSFVYADQ